MDDMMDTIIGSGATDERAPLEPGRYPAIIEDIEVEPDGQDRGVWLRVRFRLDSGRAYTCRIPTWVAWRVDQLLSAATGSCDPVPLGTAIPAMLGRKIELELRPSTRGPWLDARFRRPRETERVSPTLEKPTGDEIPF